ncbi:MAG: hypothetical protein NZ700_01500 [Gemmataceae bacterium]|nr:hypothetical protein [Gemmataceae bacterium]MDW8267178.1 hypothetical protein [Gemmataceae bacterium]
MAPAELLAGSPRLTRLSPTGGQRGTPGDVYFTGLYLQEPRDVVFYEPGIRVVSIEPLAGDVVINGRRVKVKPGIRVRVRLQLAKDCPFRPHGLRLVTAHGLTEYRRSVVGVVPVVPDEETSTKRNDQRSTAQPVALNRTVHGQIAEAFDVDVYRVEARRGDRLSAEVEAARIGGEVGVPDLYLGLCDAEGRLVASADDSALFIQDPLLSVQAQRHSR